MMQPEREHPHASAVPAEVEFRASARGASRFIATARPRLSWRTTTVTPDWVQTGATVKIDQGGTVTTHAVEGASSVGVEWPGEALHSYESVRARVTVRGADGTQTSSAWIDIESGPLTPEDWSAAFISAPQPAGGESPRATTRFRRTIRLERSLSRALLSITARGIVEMVVDGRVVSSDVLSPGWTTYADRLVFATYDVTGLLGDGEHVLGATVADGWFGEQFGFDGRFQRISHGPRSLIAQLHLEYTDGETETIVTDHSWSSTPTGPVTSASIYQGETYDAANADSALEDSAADVSRWSPVLVDRDGLHVLEPAFAPPVRVVETIEPVHSIVTPTGGHILDFGQNIAGWVRITIGAGTPVAAVIRHAEVLEDGELGTRPLRFAAATDRVTTTGDVLEWRPAFTYHGFRYVQIDGVDPERVRVVAEVVHTDLQRTGWIRTNDADVNQLHENALWSFRGNAVSLPTDCPQRDERLGWSGDIQVFSPAASFLYDSDAFLRNWLRDLAADQDREGGIVPIVSPSLGSAGFPSMPMAAWSDAITVIPWTLWERFGDRDALASLYKNMRAWVEVVRAHAVDGLWERGFQLGDWLDPTAPPESPAKARTSSAIVATAYYFRSAQILASTAALLGRDEDANEYELLTESIRAAFLATYVTPNGRMTSDAHTAYALTLAFDIAQGDTVRARLGARLADIVRSHGYRIGTGFVGTPIICDALSGAGQRDVAHRLLLERDCPSWMYPISMGATTIWERWDSMLPDGSINPGEMTSFNHYALGAVIDWIHRDIGGIAPATPGYEKVLVRPRPGRLTESSSRFDGPYGEIRVDWTVQGGALLVDVVIPPNSSASIDLADDRPVVEVGSGSHHFELPADPPAEPVTFDETSTLADVVDDLDARRAFVQQLRAVGYPMADALATEGMWRSDSPLADGLPMLPAFAVPDLIAALQNSRDSAAPTVPSSHP